MKDPKGESATLHWPLGCIYKKVTTVTVTLTVTYLAEKGFDLEMTMGNVYGDGDLGSYRCVGEMRCPSYCKYWKGTRECWLRYFLIPYSDSDGGGVIPFVAKVKI